MTDLRSRDDLAGSVRARRGAHRPAPSRVVSLLPVLLVLGAAAVLALGVWLVMGLGGADAAPAASTAAVEPAPAPTTGAPPPADAASPPAPAAGTPSEPAASSAAPVPPSPAASSPAAEASEEPAPVDTDVPVAVLNATRTQGLAASTARDLEREGWTVASTGNERGDAVTATVVRYPDAGLEATASAVAGVLGSRVAVELDPGVEDGTLTVVVGPDLAR